MQDLMINKTETILDAMRKLDICAKKILLVVENTKLLGVVTDGDIRRWILKNGSLNEEVSMVMNTNPIVLHYKDKQKAKKLMIKHNIGAVPLLDDEGNVESIVFWNDFNYKHSYKYKIDVPVVIMAGGKGTRLYPYTKILPKPLIPIGDIPIIERIINKFNEYGCRNFYLTVNYKEYDKILFWRPGKRL